MMIRGKAQTVTVMLCLILITNLLNFPLECRFSLKRTLALYYIADTFFDNYPLL